MLFCMTCLRRHGEVDIMFTPGTNRMICKPCYAKRLEWMAQLEELDRLANQKPPSRFEREPVV